MIKRIRKRNCEKLTLNVDRYDLLANGTKACPLENFMQIKVSVVILLDICIGVSPYA